jgi:hypothetical protein
VTTEPEVIDPSTVAADEAAARSAAETEPAAPAAVEEPTAETAHTPDLDRARILEMENERLKGENAALKRERADCVELANEAEAKRRDWEDLKGRAKAAKDDYDLHLDALSKKVRGEVQVQVGDADDEEGEQASIPFHGEKPAPTTVAPDQAPFGDGGPSNSDAISTRLSAGDVMKIDGLDWTQVSQAALSELVSTGKPATVRPLVLSSGAYVLTDVVDRRAVLHPLHDAEKFVNLYRTEGLKLPNEERPAELVALGSHAGIPVKVKSTEKAKRSKLAYIGSDADALILEIPGGTAISATPPAEEPEAEHQQPPAAEPIAGPGSDLVSNRILSQLAHTSSAYITVDSLAKILGVDEQVVRNAAKNDPRIVYERTDDDETVTRAPA